VWDFVLQGEKLADGIGSDDVQEVVKQAAIQVDKVEKNKLT